MPVLAFFFRLWESRGLIIYAPIEYCYSGRCRKGFGSVYTAMGSRISLGFVSSLASSDRPSPDFFDISSLLLLSKFLQSQVPYRFFFSLLALSMCIC